MELKPYKTKSGFLILPIHYSLHPERTKEWVTKVKPGYTPDAWDREMEIDFTKTEEKRVYKFFSDDVHGKKLKYNKDLPLLRGWDFGYNTAACVFAQWLPSIDQLAILGEVIVRDSTIYEFKPAVINYCRKEFPEGFYQDYCDISGTFKSERAERTSVEVLNDSSIAFAEVYPMARKADVMRGLSIIRNLLAVRKDGKPGLIIDIEKCPVLVRGFKGEYVLGKKDKPKVDQHPIDDPHDALRYLVENFIPTTGFSKDEDEDSLTEEKLWKGFKSSKYTGYRR